MIWLLFVVYMEKLDNLALHDLCCGSYELPYKVFVCSAWLYVGCRLPV